MRNGSAEQEALRPALARLRAALVPGSWRIGWCSPLAPRFVRQMTGAAAEYAAAARQTCRLSALAAAILRALPAQIALQCRQALRAQGPLALVEADAALASLAERLSAAAAACAMRVQTQLRLMERFALKTQTGRAPAWEALYRRWECRIHRALASALVRTLRFLFGGLPGKSPALRIKVSRRGGVIPMCLFDTAAPARACAYCRCRWRPRVGPALLAFRQMQPSLSTPCAGTSARSCAPLARLCPAGRRAPASPCRELPCMRGGGGLGMLGGAAPTRRLGNMCPDPGNSFMQDPS